MLGKEKTDVRRVRIQSVEEFPRDLKPDHSQLAQKFNGDSKVHDLMLCESIPREDFRCPSIDKSYKTEKKDGSQPFNTQIRRDESFPRLDSISHLPNFTTKTVPQYRAGMLNPGTVIQNPVENAIETPFSLAERLSWPTFPVAAHQQGIPSHSHPWNLFPQGVGGASQQARDAELYRARQVHEAILLNQLSMARSASSWTDPGNMLGRMLLGSQWRQW
jgi:hypothetical protein